MKTLNNQPETLIKIETKPINKKSTKIVKTLNNQQYTYPDQQYTYHNQQEIPIKIKRVSKKAIEDVKTVIVQQEIPTKPIAIKTIKNVKTAVSL